MFSFVNLLVLEIRKAVQVTSNTKIVCDLFNNEEKKKLFFSSSVNSVCSIITATSKSKV